jgi:hypothetical protein
MDVALNGCPRKGRLRLPNRQGPDNSFIGAGFVSSISAPRGSRVRFVDFGVSGAWVGSLGFRVAALARFLLSVIILDSGAHVPLQE